MTKNIVVLGSLNVDNIMKMPRMPLVGETMALTDVTTAPGGKGANQAVAAARQGANVSFIGSVGNDSNGQFMRATLLSNGVNVNAVTTNSEVPTGSAYIMLQENGANTILIHGGANQALTVADLDENVIAKADTLIAQFEVPLEVIVAAFKIAKANNVQTILNPAPAVYDLIPELTHVTDIILPNETEAQLLTGITVENNEAVLNRVSNAILAKGVPRSIITLGDAGSFVADRDKRWWVKPNKVDAVDTTGAGDTFIGTLASVIDADFNNLEETVKRASIASAIAVTRAGAIPSIPTRDEVDAF
ncbi:ribokinase [Leuconostoc gasicomitatum]|uniref:Ribokinase n=2 Tax=Leuconostoc TaxID=1243 RepID=A0AAN2QVK7_9LACO|nr:MULTISPECIES: ribokinase [Leuconostoc]MBZ5956472.1 ribokinase [Leuconostoc gasicomitatum]MBZ5959568.1 ribokinase [Leuconostoc gasicomitatum]MBZ5966648.1 ribokinase [Leuconostoc gasicomitatum]MBZ5979643.1 ribokinase [Leuconostoc gasicomitatum]MBZ5982430.1 ribokinase [Leuconostoc gasicomitatum]